MWCRTPFISFISLHLIQPANTLKNTWTASPIKSPRILNLTHSKFTSIAGFNYGLVVMMTNSRAGYHGQDHLLTSLLIHLHHDHNILTDNSQSLLHVDSRISPRALLLFVSGCIYVINSAPAHWQTFLSIT